VNKDDLIRSVAEHMQAKKASAALAVDVIFDAITESLKQGNPVTLVGFGSFKVSKRAARQGRNPRTGEPLSIPATTIPSFTAGKGLKDVVNGGKL
jgi:DNA-binding protein HU-beta